MVTIVVTAIVTLAVLFFVMLVLGVFVSYPWILLAIAVYVLWRAEIRPRRFPTSKEGS